MTRTYEAKTARAPMRDAQYIKRGGTRCPYCRSREIEGHGVEIDAGYAAQEIVCNDCRRTWTDIYRLVGYQASSA